MMNNSFVSGIENMNQSTKQNRAGRQPATPATLLKLCLTGTALAWGLAASAQTSITNMNFTVGAIIPDADASGLVSAQTISTPITNVTGLKVALKLSGTWSGDLYCFLSHGTGHSVLLNRVGRGSASDLGYNDMGLDMTFDDAATNGDIHVYRSSLSSSQDTPISGPLTSVWAPDARVAYPTNVLDSDARSAFLSSFNGVDPNGEWVLFVADLESGDIHQLESWGLEITGGTAPEQSFGQSTEGSTGGATRSGTAMNQVRSQLAASTSVVPAVLKGITADSGRVRLTFSGSAASTYGVERAASLQNVGTVWTNIGTATTDKAGQGEFTDTNPPAVQGYYRTVSQ
jgi:subtilisin-like proprotein convertase family protein